MLACSRSLLVAIAVLAPLVAQAGTPFVSNLGSADFPAFVRDHRLVLVNFCSHSDRECKRLAHEWNTAARDSGAGDELKFATVDCLESQDVCGKYNITTYPTVLPFESGSPVPAKRFNAPVINALAQELKKAPAAKRISSEDELNLLIGEGVSVIAFTDTEDDDCMDVFNAVAARPPVPASFAVAPTQLLSKIWTGTKAKSGPTILLKAPFHKTPVSFTNSECSLDALDSFIKRESFPLVGAISNTNYNQYVNRGFPLVWCFLQSGDHRSDHLAILEKAAEGFKDKLSFVWLDAESFRHHATALGLSGQNWPGVVIDDQKTKKKYVFESDAEFKAESLSDFASKVLSGEIKPTVKSQEIPADTSAALTTVVGKNYAAVVLESDADVFLMVHAHWCGHCQRALPRVNGTAELFHDTDAIKVAAIDADLNDVPLDYQGFPTIFFFPASKKDKPIVFSGERNVQGFTKFILEHTTKSLSAEKKQSILEHAKNTDQQLDKPETPEHEAEKDEL